MKRIPWGPVFFALATAASLALFWQLRYYVEFTDETDVPVFGRLLKHGRILHGDAFSHHTHLEPLFSWLVTTFYPDAGIAAMRFGVWVLQMLAALSLVFSPMFKERGPGWVAGAAFLFLSAMAGPLWFGHMSTAYTLWGQLCLISLALCHFPRLLGVEVGPGPAFLGGLATSLWIMGSPFTVFPAAALGFALWAARPWAAPGSWKPLAYGLAAGLLVQGLWFALHADLGRAWEQVIVFNAKVFSPFTDEPVGLAGRLKSVASDFWGLLWGQEKVERVFLLGGFLAVVTVYFHGRRINPDDRRLRPVLAALAFGAFLMALRARGGHWRALPYIFACIGGWSLLLGQALEGRRILLTLLSLYALSQVYKRAQWSYDQGGLLGVNSYLGSEKDPALGLALKWKKELPKESTVLALPFRASVYILSGLDPGMDSVYWYPWISSWEKQGGRGKHGALCDQVAHYKPEYILLHRDAMLWQFPFKEYIPACLDPLLKSAYERKSYKGKEELWRLKKQKPKGAA